MPQANSRLYSARRHPKGHRAARDHASTSTRLPFDLQLDEAHDILDGQQPFSSPAWDFDRELFLEPYAAFCSIQRVHSQILLKTRAGSHLGKRQAHLFGDHSYNSVLNAHTTIAWFFAILSPELMRILFNKRYNQTGRKSAEQETEQLRFGIGNLRQPSHETK